ncbi:MAG TPA: hypothetical protein VFB12_27935 [Ktedonobacteraceae bacterium]|nr:hypothetical protein [Ktedonobacteraceae bacterium]
MPATSSPLTPRSALRHRPISSSEKTEEPPRVSRASRTHQTKETVEPFVRTTLPHTASQQRQGVGLVWLGTGMLMALAAVLLGQLVVGWITITWDDWHYGRPRTFQCDAVVGHADSPAQPSHFIALNLKGHIEVIELPGGDPSHTRIYQGPQIYGPGADLVPVTLQFPDPGHTHHPDMLILFQGTQVVLHNVDGTFRSD